VHQWKNRNNVSSGEIALSVHVKTLQRRKSPRIPWGFRSESSGGTTSRRMCTTKLKIQEFAEEKEDRDREAFLIIGSHSKFLKE
jgi:hypothetical protein